MPRRKKEDYTTTVNYTEGYVQRITEAFVEVHYNRKWGIFGPGADKTMVLESPDGGQKAQVAENVENNAYILE